MTGSGAGGCGRGRSSGFGSGSLTGASAAACARRCRCTRHPSHARHASSNAHQASQPPWRRDRMRCPRSRSSHARAGPSDCLAAAAGAWGSPMPLCSRGTACSAEPVARAVTSVLVSAPADDSPAGKKTASAARDDRGKPFPGAVIAAMPSPVVVCSLLDAREPNRATAAPCNAVCKPSLVRGRRGAIAVAGTSGVRMPR